MTRARDLAKLIAGGGSITIDDNSDNLILTSTDADASSGPNLRMYRNSASPADVDEAGNILFVGRNDNSQDVTYGEIEVYAMDVSDGTEDGLLNINTVVGGTGTSRIKAITTETVINDDSKDLDFRVESDGNTNALFVDAGNNVVVVGSDVAENRLAQPFAVTSAGARGGMTINSFYNSSSGPIVDFQVSRNDTAGSHTVIQTNDALGTIIFRGDDGDEFKDAGAIECNVDATPGNDDMPGRLCFFTSPDGSGGLVERMRIDRNGALLVGTTSNIIRNDGFRVMPDGSSGGTLVECFNDDGGIALDVGRGGSNGECQRFFRGSSQVGNISVTTSATAFNTSSDYRLKENVTDITDGITRVKQLSPKRFNFIVDADTTVDGFLAHEAQTVVPEAITGTKDEVEVWEDSDELPDGVSVGDNKLDDDGKTIPVMQSIDQAKLVPLLTAALQEAIAEIETLKTKVAALEAE